MQNIISFLYKLQEDNIQIWLSNEGKIQLRYSTGNPPEDVVAFIKQFKAKIIELLDDNNCYEPQPAPFIYRLNQQEGPLSFSQYRLWFFEKFQQESEYSYNESVFLKFQHPLDFLILKEAFMILAEQHPILRTVIEEDGEGKPYQKIASTRDFSPCLSREMIFSGELLHVLSKESKTYFNLTSPLISIKYFDITDTSEVVLSIVQHHLITDGRSIGLLFNDLMKVYQNLKKGVAATLNTLSCNYNDFVIWQHSYLTGSRVQEQLHYWESKLNGYEDINLPIDKSRPSDYTYNGKVLYFSLDLPLVSALQRLVKSSQSSLFIVMLSAFFVLLKKYTGQNDLIIGTSIANRNYSQLEDIVGLFINILPLRVDMKSEKILDIINNVKKTCLEAYDNQDVPFQHLVEKLYDARDTSRPPIIQVVFEHQNATNIKDVDLDGEKASAIELEDYDSEFDLSLDCVEIDGVVKGRLIYNTDLYMESTVSKMLQHYKSILEEITQNPTVALSEIDMLTSDDYNQLSVWNQTDVALPQGINTVLDAFDQQVSSSPHHVAVTYQMDSLTYLELDNRVNQLANQLLTFDLPKESLVALYLDRDIDYLVCMLAVWRSGLAFYPLSPSDLTQKNLDIINQVSGKLLLTKQCHYQAAGQLVNNNIIQLVDVFDLPGNEVVDKNHVIHPCDTAYVIFTSGSTGKPKGAIVSHAGMLNHLFAKVSDFSIQEKTCVAQTSSQTFDVSIWQYLVALLVGGTTVVFSDEEAWHPTQLLLSLNKKKVNLYESVPSHFALILEELELNREKHHLPDLNYMMMNGEGLSPKYCRRWFKLFPDIPMANVYGPTECSDDVTHYIFNSVDCSDGKFLSIGSPIQNVKMYVLDEDLNYAPIGAVGELYVSGICVGKGYLNLPEKTKESFIKKSIRDNAEQELLYKTGDLVRWLPGGMLEYLERIDNQIKINGQRIELEEINQKILRHEAISTVTTQVNVMDNDDEALTSYVVLNKNRASESLTGHRVDEWKKLWDEFYIDNSDVEKKEFNISGWYNSYDGKSFSSDEAQESINNTVEKVLSLKPKKILEIGCGTGLILFQVAPSCEKYCGIDMAPGAVSYIQEQLGDLHLDNVEVTQGSIDNLDSFKETQFDLIIINNTVQYFPDMAYFMKVLDISAKYLTNDGALFLGDLYNHRLLDSFHQHVAFYKAKEATTVTRYLNQVRLRVANEEQLYIDPAFFCQLPDSLSEIFPCAKIDLKKGGLLNEMLKYRYDVILKKQNLSEQASLFDEIDAADEIISLSFIESLLERSEEKPIKINRIFNKRLAEDQSLIKALKSQNDSSLTLGVFKSELEKIEIDEGIDPDDVLTMANEKGWLAHISWAESGDHMRYDVVLCRNEKDLSSFVYKPTSLNKSNSLIGDRNFSNDPLYMRRFNSINLELRKHLSNLLPNHMIPSIFMIIDNLPLNQNGKLDKNALPQPIVDDRRVEEAYIAPRNEVEENLASIWAEVLNREKIGVGDDFFAIGGHSLNATQVAARIQRFYSMDFPIRTLFDCRTIEGLAKIISYEVINDEVF
jgi:amino acid adenylation domain-containing protein